MDVFRASVESTIQYAAPAWSGFCTAGDRDTLNAFLRRCVKLGYRDKSASFIEDIFGDSRINTNSLHILQQYLPDRPTSSYSLRPRRHNKNLITKTSGLSDRNFIIRNIYKDLYWFPHVLELYASRPTLLILYMSFTFCNGLRLSTYH